MVKKKRVELNTVEGINTKVTELKIELAKFKGMLASKTKSNNTAKKRILKKDIARLLTKRNQLSKVTQKSNIKKSTNKEIPQKKESIKKK